MAISPLIVLAVGSVCSHHPLSLKQAEALVLAAPDIQASAAERGAQPFFEWVGRGPNGWRLDVSARNPCERPGPCSKLLGHYAVDQRTGEVIDLDAGEHGKAVSSPRLARLRARFLKVGCP